MVGYKILEISRTTLSGGMLPPYNNYSFNKERIMLTKTEYNTNVLLTIDGMQIPVIIINHKLAYGRTLYLIKPVGGCGEKWVSEDRVIERK